MVAMAVMEGERGRGNATLATSRDALVTHGATDEVTGLVATLMDHSCGPATSYSGKFASSQNAWKHGLRAREWLDYQNRINDLLRGRDRLRRV
jgi:hypothetical protein